MEKVLIISDILPSKNQTGGILTSSLIRFLIEEKIDVNFFGLVNKHLRFEKDEDIDSFINYCVVTKADYSDENFASEYQKVMLETKKSLKKFVSVNNITKIIGIIQGKEMLEILDFCENSFSIPLYVQIWDPIEWWIKESKITSVEEKEILTLFDKVITNSSGVLTASKNMSDIYSKKYGKKCSDIMLPCLKQNVKTIKHSDNFIISMAGQIYARKELDELFCALDEIKWEYKGKRIVFNYYGNYVNNSIDFFKHSNYKNNIIIKGFYYKNELLKELSQSDLLYCPYFFTSDKDKKKVSIESFPSKVSMYCGLDIPILLHAPSYSSIAMCFKNYDLSSFSDSLEFSNIVKLFDDIEDNKNKILELQNKIFEDIFSLSSVKKNFFVGIDIDYDDTKKYRILEVNNTDLAGKRFNGFDLLHMINSTSNNICKQIVTCKSSDCPNVLKFYDNICDVQKEWKLLELEDNILHVHSQLSLTSNILKNNMAFQNADLVHYHLIDNTKLNLKQMIELSQLKPTVITLHDPWFFTGHCVYPQECTKWKTGCKNCPYIDRLFALKEDNSHSLWELKGKIYEQLDVDVIVSTPFMTKMIDECPLTNFKNVHVVPFGINLEEFKYNISQKEARKMLSIPTDDVVIFLRAQLAMKGTEYVLEALKLLNTEKNVTIVTCSETGLLDDVKDKFNIIDLGDIQDDTMHLAYNACDFFLMPSKGETFGLMAIEAMASSKPVIVFDNSALPYVTFAPECGILVENKNSERLMEAIKWMIDDPKERIRRGKLGRKLAEENYDVNVYNSKILEVYTKAYERQKNKCIFNDVTKVFDFSSEDVKQLILRLKIVFEKMFPEYDMDIDFLRYSRDAKYNSKFIIDYSNDCVQEVIRLFNAYVYDILYKPREEFYPLISVIIPVYNGEDYIETAIKSVLEQDYKNYELIVVDDGSTDDTEKIVKKYKNELTYYKKSNGGVSSALNYGIERMNGDYFSWLSHDDVYKNNKLSAEVELLKSLTNKQTIIFSNFDLIDKNGTLFSTTNFDKKINVELLEQGIYPILKGCVNGCTILIPKICFIESGFFDEKLRTTNDYDMWMRLFSKYKHRFINLSLIQYRIHDKQDTNVSPVYQSESDVLWSNIINSISDDDFKGWKLSRHYVYSNLYIQMKNAGLNKSAKLAFNYAKKNFDDSVGISVIMPTYNSEKYLGIAIDSILSQTFSDFELIVIDDGSTDGTTNIIKKYQKMDYRIRACFNLSNKGVAVRLNDGLKMARGKYFTRLDSDDVAAPERLLKQFQFLENNKYDYCGTNISFINESGIVTKHSCYTPVKCPMEFALCFTNPIPNATLMYKMNVIKKYKLSFNNFKVAEDYAFLVNYSLHGKGYFIDEDLYQYRLLNNSLFHQNGDYALVKSLQIVNNYYRIVTGKDAPGYLVYLTDFYPVLEEVDVPTLSLIFSLSNTIVEAFAKYYKFSDYEKQNSINYVLSRLFNLYNIANHNNMFQSEINSVEENKPIVNQKSINTSLRHKFNYYYKAHGKKNTLKWLILYPAKKVKKRILHRD